MRSYIECFKGDEKMQPDTITYTTVLKAWSKSMEPDKGERAEALLREMYREHENGAMTKPNSVSRSLQAGRCSLSIADL